MGNLDVLRLIVLLSKYFFVVMIRFCRLLVSVNNIMYLVILGRVLLVVFVTSILMRSITNNVVPFLFPLLSMKGGSVFIIMILMILLSVAFLVLLERKLLGGVQLRTRPTNVRYWRVLQTVMDRLKLLNKPSAINNVYSFTFLVIILIIGFTSGYYIMIVIMLALILLLLNRIILSSNIYSKMGRYRLIVLA